MLALLVLLLAAPRASGADSYETVPAIEPAAAARIADLISAGVTKDKQETGAAHRDAHAKAHGCVRAQFKVEASLPPELRQGVFQEGKAYSAWIRYSNGSGKPQNDAVVVGCGLVVLFLGVFRDKLADEKGTQVF